MNIILGLGVPPSRAGLKTETKYISPEQLGCNRIIAQTSGTRQHAVATAERAIAGCSR
jgi:hypothetical protein